MEGWRDSGDRGIEGWRDGGMEGMEGMEGGERKGRGNLWKVLHEPGR